MSKSIELSDELYHKLLSMKKEDESINDIISKLIESKEEGRDKLEKWLLTPYIGDEETDSVVDHDVIN